MFETNFSGHNKMWKSTTNVGVTAPECPPVAAGLVFSR